jgi:hypothetical protein
MGRVALTLPVYLWVGALFHRGALEAARHLTTNMDTLVSLGATVAFGYSVIATIAFPGRTAYYDVAALIITLIAVGKYLELADRARAGAAIDALAEQQPRVGHPGTAWSSARRLGRGRGLLRVAQLVWADVRLAAPRRSLAHPRSARPAKPHH